MASSRRGELKMGMDSIPMSEDGPPISYCNTRHSVNELARNKLTGMLSIVSQMGQSHLVVVRDMNTPQNKCLPRLLPSGNACQNVQSEGLENSLARELLAH